MNRFLTPIALVFTSLLLTGCGSGSSSSPDVVQDPITITDIDTDGDGTIDRLDTDDDNDGVSDSDDAFPKNANESKDTDADGVGDNGDTCPNTESSQPSNNLGCSAIQFTHASCQGKFNIEGGRSYQVVLPFTDTDETEQRISFQILEPANFDCNNIARGAHPLMMHGPGYSGSRSTSGFDNYRNDGYTVISWDPRGFGDTSGASKGMDPEFEGRYLIAILDWVEQNLDYLAWRNESSQEFITRPVDGISIANGDNLLIGSQGSSYGGGYQLLLLSADPKKRLDAIAPDITWHDLRDALNPGDVVKTVWGSVLGAGGSATGSVSYFSEETLDAESNILDDGQDPFIQETLSRSVATNEWPRRSLDWFEYRGGFGAWCKASALPTLPYPIYGTDTVPMIDANDSFNNPEKQANGLLGYGNFLVQPANPAQYLTGLDVLLTQGMTDTLFHFNQAWWNRQCLSAAGANVSLYTHNSGHVLPYAQSPDKPTVDSGSCGFYSSDEQKPWFDARLNPLNGSTSELPANTAKETCFALGTIDDNGISDTVELAAMDVLAPGGAATENFTDRQITPLTPVPNGPAGYMNLSARAPVIASLGIIQTANSAILAGIPHLTVIVSSAGGINETLQDCDVPDSPTRTGCDSITFVGIGKKVPAGNISSPNFTLIDDQLQPIRGLGEHDIDLVGIAERLQPGDELAVMFYAVHPQFASSASRDLTIPAVNISGKVWLPLYVSDADGQPDLNGDTEALLPIAIQ
jgi:pimeloyl-ACP methyl ester carboxylesterase